MDGLRALAEFQMEAVGRTGGETEGIEGCEPTDEDGLGFAMRRLKVLGGGRCMPGRPTIKGGTGGEGEGEGLRGLSGSGRRWDFALCPDLFLWLHIF